MKGGDDRDEQPKKLALSGCIQTSWTSMITEMWAIVATESQWVKSRATPGGGSLNSAADASAKNEVKEIRGNGNVTVVCGSRGDGFALPPMCIFPRATIVNAKLKPDQKLDCGDVEEMVKGHI